MSILNFIKTLNADQKDNAPVDLTLTGEIQLQCYPKSVLHVGQEYIFVARTGLDKALFVSAQSGDSVLAQKLTGEKVRGLEEDIFLWRCPMSRENAAVIRELADFTRPVLIGVTDSFGFGDRLGIANPGHLRSLEGSHMKPVLAQQSIRELTRTQREAQDVIDAATWAVLQEGYRHGFGADADHLKTFADIDVTVKAGFTMFTIDPGEYVVNEADNLDMLEVENQVKVLPWSKLGDDLAGFIDRYQTHPLHVAIDLVLNPGREEILRGLLKYGSVIVHTVEMIRYLKETYPHHPAEFELSVDETDSVTTPFEHYLVANELKRLGVELVSLAPRFIGDFEKGIDYKGDLEVFAAEYVKHVRIAEALGPYKISIHSGSDKFKVYEAIGALGVGAVHVKTAGTSYLEALRAVAALEPALFREILEFSRGLFESEKKTYYVSAKLGRVPAADSSDNNELLSLFDQDDARQVLHVTFGKVLTSQDGQGQYRFRARIMSCLRSNESVHYEYLIKHLKRHLAPFSLGKTSAEA